MKSKKIRRKFLIIFLVFILIISVFVGIYNYTKTEAIVKNAEIVEKNTSIILSSIEEEEIIEEEIDKYNCNYEIEESTNTIKIDTYTGTEDGIIIDEVIDETYITQLEIKEDAFAESDNLEMIKIVKSLAEDIDDIEDFAISEELSGDEYIVYVTTKTYTENYIAYIELSEDEKEEVDVIPEKFEELTSMISEDEASSLYSIDTDDIPSSFDLREGNSSLDIDAIEIGVENQRSTGICYAYATLTSAETYISKYFLIDEDFSELHLAVLSSQGSGGNFTSSYNNYLRKAYGPIDETYLSSEDIYEKYKNSTASTEETLIYEYCIDDDAIGEDELTTAQTYATNLYTDDLDYYVMDYVSFSITGAKKSDSTYDETIEETRNNIKLQIMEYGSVTTYIDIGTAKYNTINGYTTLYVSEDSKDDTIDHAVSIIGWDDDFSKENFADPETEEQPEEDGAFLVLNSWGSTWGAQKDGTFWVSYEDYFIESSIYGITAVAQEQVSAGEFTVSLGATEYTYDGTEKEPSVTVRYDGDGNGSYRALTNGTDYEVTYSNNVNAGTATVTVTGINRFSGTTTKSFTINALDISETTIKLGTTEYTYDGTEKEPEVTVTYNGTTLVQGTDYTVTYSNNINAGTGVVIITGIGNYTGTTEEFKDTSSLSFTINALDISETTIKLETTEYTYDGTEKEPEVIATYNGTTLVQGTDYEVIYSNNINVGTATATITGIGNYTETVTEEFTINKAENTLEVFANSNLVYTGSELYLVSESNAQGDVYYSLTEELTSSNYTENEINELPTAIDAGIYTVYYYSPGNTNYKEISGSVTNIEISKAMPDYTTPAGINAVEGETLEDLTLPDNFTWEEDLSTSVGEVGENVFTVTYTPDDYNNYNSISGIEITVTVYSELKVTINEYTVEENESVYYIEEILTGNYIETILNNIETNGIITIYDNDEQEITDTSITAKTGMKIKVEKDMGSWTDSMEYILVVTGDTNGDGVVTSVDLLKLARYLADLDTDLSGEYLLAANVYKDESDSSSINDADLLKFARVLVDLDEF